MKPFRVLSAVASATVMSILAVACQNASATGTGRPPQTAATLPGTPSAATSAGSFIVSEAQFNKMFPSRNAFYTYRGLTDALSAYPQFATTGDTATRKREAAAFLANVSHETGGLRYVIEQNKANYPHYCDTTQPYGCPAGKSAYHGRGPLQLSWNFNYKAAGDALGTDLLHDPNQVQNNPATAWKTGLWFWNAQKGAGSMTPHDAIVTNQGFGQTIRSLNGTLECGGKNPAERNDRISLYKRFVAVLGVDVGGGNVSC